MTKVKFKYQPSISLDELTTNELKLLKTLVESDLKAREAELNGVVI